MAQLDHGSPSGFKPLMAPQAFENLVTGWQQRAVRMMRAQERMANSMVAAARLEMRFGQELMASRLGMLNWSTTEPSQVSEQASQDFDSFIHVIRDVTQELRNGFAEATQILTDAAQQPAARPNGANGSAEPLKAAEAETHEAEPEPEPAEPKAAKAERITINAAANAAAVPPPPPTV